MSFIRVNEVGGDSLERVNKLLHNIPGGVYKAAFSALRRAGDTAKTRAGQFAAAEYTINKGEFCGEFTPRPTSQAVREA